MTCALARTWPALLVFRFLVDAGAPAPQAVIGGIFEDLFPDQRPRGTAVMILRLKSNVGPFLGPIIAGVFSTSEWRRMFWIRLIMAGAN